MESTFADDRELLRTLALSRQEARLHHDLPRERRMLQYIREGRESELERFMQSEWEQERVGVLSRSSLLRHRKNLAICGITLYTRAAIEGGVDSEIAFTLSDLYIQRLEDLHTAQSVDDLNSSAMLDFARRVRGVREQSAGRTFEACRHYIFSHLYEDLPLSRLGRAFGLNPTYLSRLCKKETGFPLSAYIRRERIEEAKRLLDLGEYRLSDICALLRWSDQSHFTQAFKQQVGITPGAYRKRRAKEF
ncbi:helix-turn-helix domain-containing protein [Saccharibacillus sp. CPCC 101409]|uniref:helix-turn-helix domain-containing protein n=1 Tax=Saccharibacillus sp. CPCC 101409 TaxID=3058041 RepID=UPI00267183A4|nr:helix-turn-helix domain-containing protein [Saccharibacillus sp. CPCC 101409]MDO3409324.1 helix-turn-helix domain-containing protein [Saccharibacillus sp. CPCC 101409]